MGFHPSEYNPDSARLEFAIRKQQAIEIVTTILGDEYFTAQVDEQPNGWGARTKGFLVGIQDQLIAGNGRQLSDKQYNWLVSIYENVVVDGQWRIEKENEGWPEKTIRQHLRQRREARKSERES